jgi:hypothetical protein
MFEVFWGTLSVCVVALTAAGVALMLTQRKLAEKAACSLDSLNRELPAILDAARLAAEDAEALLSLGRKLGKTAAWAGGILKGLRAMAGLFGGHAQDAHSKEVSHERS